MSVFKKFISYYKPYKVLFWVDMGCALLLSAIDLAFPQILDYLTENVFNRPAHEVIASLKFVAVALLVMYVVKFGCQYFITGWGHIMGARMESDMLAEDPNSKRYSCFQEFMDEMEAEDE